MGGSLEATKQQIKSLEVDLKEFKGINQKYTDQLIKVKVCVSLDFCLEVTDFGRAVGGYGQRRLGEVCQGSGQVSILCMAA